MNAYLVPPVITTTISYTYLLYLFGYLEQAYLVQREPILCMLFLSRDDLSLYLPGIKPIPSSVICAIQMPVCTQPSPCRLKCICLTNLLSISWLSIHLYWLALLINKSRELVNASTLLYKAIKSYHA